jgi:hypothetical protein
MPQALIYYNENGYQAAIAIMQEKAALIQQIVDAYDDLELQALTNEEFGTLVRNPNSLVYDKMTAGAPIEIGGLPVTREKGMELLEKPEGYHTLINKIQEVFATFGDTHVMPLNYPVNKGNFDTFFELGDGSEVRIVGTIEQKIMESFKKYATSDAAIKLLGFAETLRDLINDSDILRAIGTTNELGKRIGELLNIPQSNLTDPVSVRPEGITHYNNSLFVS